jgi:hypothetical protein
VTDLRQGDVIELMRMELEGCLVRERWYSASIDKITDGSILVTGISRPILNERGWIPKAEKGSMWR